MRQTLMLLLLTMTLAAAVAPRVGVANSTSIDKEELMKEVYGVYRDIVWLEKNGVDTGNLTLLLNKTIEYIERGDYGKARRLLSVIKSDIDKLRAKSDEEAFWRETSRVLIAIAALAAPIVFYLAFPRLYIALWIRIYGEWVVDEVS